MSAPARPVVEVVLPQRSAAQQHLDPVDIVELVLDALESTRWEPTISTGDGLSMARDAARRLLVALGIDTVPPAVVGPALLAPCGHTDERFPTDLPCGAQLTLGVDPAGGIIASCFHGHVRWVGERPPEPKREEGSTDG